MQQPSFVVQDTILAERECHKVAEVVAVEKIPTWFGCSLYTDASTADVATGPGYKPTAPSFIRDKCSHPTLCLPLIELY